MKSYLNKKNNHDILEIDDIITNYNLSVFKKDVNKDNYYKKHIYYDSLYNKNIINKLKSVNKLCICGIPNGKCLDCYPNNKIKNEINRPPKVTMNNAYYEYYYYKGLFNKKDVKNNLRNQITKNDHFLKKGFQNENNFIKDIINKHMHENNIYNIINKQKDDRIKKIKEKIIFGSKKRVAIKLIKNCLNKIKEKKEKNNPEYVNMKTSKKIIKLSNNFVTKSLFSTIKNDNRNRIDTFSTYYEQFIINKKDDDIKNVRKMYDRNHSRFLRLIELSYLIKKDDDLYNSNLIFNYHTLAKLHKKDDNFDDFLKLLKDKYIEDYNNK